MDKPLPDTDSPPSRPRSMSGTREVLLSLRGEGSVGSDEPREPVEPVVRVEAPQPTYESCQVALDAEHARLKKPVPQKDKEDASFLPALSEYAKHYQAVGGFIKKKSKAPALILLEIAKLEPLFRRGLELFPVKQAEAAKTELAGLKESSTAADRVRMDKLRAAERVRLFDLEKDLAAKKKQIEALEKNLQVQTIPKTQQDTRERITTAKQEKSALETKLAELATVKSEYEDALRENDTLKERIKASQKRFDEIAEQQQAQILAARTRATQLAARCLLLQKDSSLPDPISRASEAVPQDIDASTFVNAGCALDTLEGLLDAEENQLRKTHPQRDGFLEALTKLEKQAQLIEDEDLASGTYSEAHEEKLAALRRLAAKRNYDEALAQAARLLEEVHAWIEEARKAQQALEEALNLALDDIAFYEEGEHIDDDERKAMYALVDQARSNDDFVDALQFVNKIVKTKIQWFLERQAQWREVSAPVRVRKPRQTPNYGQAADHIVDLVLSMFRSTFDYAGPSLNVQELYPRERYNPGRLKQALRNRFATLSPSGQLPRKGLGPRCYFNLGAGGTTKKKYEYNVKVRREGVDRALAQIHIIYP